MATGINYCQNGRLAKAKVTLVFWTQALSHIICNFLFKKGHYNSSMHNYGCYGAIFAFRDEAIASTTCVEAKKEAWRDEYFKFASF